MEGLEFQEYDSRPDMVFSSEDEFETWLAFMNPPVDPPHEPEQIPEPDVPEPPRRKRRLHGKQPVDVPRAPKDNKTERRAALCGLTPNCVRRLMHAGWPIMLFNWLAMLFVTTPGGFERTLSCVEYFSGVAVVAGTFEDHGRRSATFDICTHEVYENLNTPEGFCTALSLGMRLKKSALAHWATVCSSFIFLSKGTTKRTDENPWGFDRPSVRTANQQVVRMLLIIILLKARKVAWLLEQPMTSTMCKIPLWSAVAPQGSLLKTSTWMGAFGAPTRKPTWLMSTHAWTEQLSRKLSRDAGLGVPGTTVLLVDASDGRKRVCGGPRLKETQAYPVGYGRAVHQYWEEWQAELDGEEDDASSVASSVSDTDYAEISTEHGDIAEACRQLGVRTSGWDC